MLRGLVLGSVSGLSLSALIVGTMSLVAPPNGGQPNGGQAHRPVAALPDAPVLRDQADAAPRMPDALPPQGSGPAVLQEPATDGADTPKGDRLAAEAAARPAEAPPAVDRAAAVPLPVASAFNRPREDGEVVMPGSDPVSRPAVVTEGLRVADAVPRDGLSLQTQSAVRPPETRVAGFGVGPEAGQGPDLPRTRPDDAPPTFAEVPLADVPRPAEETVIAIDTEAAARPPRMPPAAPPAVPAAASGAEPAGQAGEGTASGTGRARTRPPVTLVEEDDRVIPPPAAAPDPTVEVPNAADAGTTPRRLVLDSAEQVVTARAETAEERRDALSGALVRQAARFDNPDDLPLLAIILIEVPGSGLPRDRLADLGFPVTVALDPTEAGIAAAARAYRAAGHEVVMQTVSLAPGGAAQDIEVAVAAARAALPQALGVLDGAPEPGVGGAVGGGAGGFATDRTALAALLPALAEAGMGFLAPSGGLNSGIASARRGGVPAMPVPRALDESGEEADAILQALTRASVAAGRDGAVIVVGHARPETIEAIETWRRGNRSDGIVAAPISAVLTGFGR